MTRPILYSFRRCPYAMRARLAIQSAGIDVEIREIVLKDKAPEFLAASPKGTVPVVVDGPTVIEQSLDIMHWALGQRDPDGWLDMPPEGETLIATNDGPFKDALDRTKYATRYPDADGEAERAKAMAVLDTYEARLNPWLFGDAPRLADFALLPFVRQFAFIDRARFDDEAGPKVKAWLDGFLTSDRFGAVMPKLAKWEAGDPVTLFPFRDL